MEVKTFLKDNWKNILLVVSLLAIIALIMSTTCANRKADMYENNIKALTDTIHTYQLQNGELLYEKQGYILEKAELEKYLDLSKKETKELEKKLKSSVATIAKLQASVRVDTLRMTDSIYVTDDNTYRNEFKYSDRWLVVNGNTEFTLNPYPESHTIINNIGMELPLKVGTTEDNKWFVTSDCPYVQFTSIEGANLEKAKTKHWGMGPTITAGVGYGWGTDFKGGNTNGGLIAGVMVGWSIHYDVFEW